VRQKHTLIVGGTRGLGRALVNTLAAQGQTLSVIGRRPPAEKEQQLADVHHWSVDLRDQKRLDDALTEVLARHGNFSSLVFFQRYRGDDDMWAGELATSLTATRSIIDRAADNFEETHDKSVVIVSSCASYFVAAEQPLSYHVVKAALNQLVRYYAVALGRKGIRVNAVSPSTLLKEESKHYYLQNEALHQLYQSIIPLGRMGTAEELAKVIAFLCSANSSFITGQNICVDGGVSLHWHESLARLVGSLHELKVTR
jgi:NAD(P)-dependent dehydrogenase (short-subunit alcohol dehydrogenase family)